MIVKPTNPWAKRAGIAAIGFLGGLVICLVPGFLSESVDALVFLIMFVGGGVTLASGILLVLCLSRFETFDRIFRERMRHGQCGHCGADIRDQRTNINPVCRACNHAIPRDFVCRNCRYDLRATIPTGRQECPECGEPFFWHIGDGSDVAA